MNSKFLSKAQTLIFLKDNLKTAEVPPTVIINRKDWNTSPLELLEKINHTLSHPLIVRSSSNAEDTLEYSNAGKYLSIQNVDQSNLRESINKVFNSYSDQLDYDEIFIQPFVQNVELSGVAFSHDPSRNSPYRIINWTKSEDTTLVTSGKGGSIWIQVDCCKKTPKDLSPVIKTINELLKIFSGQPIDIEFAITNDRSKKILWLLQARKLITKKIENSIYFESTLKSIHKDLIQNFNSQDQLLGEKTIFGVMPDWNPAEIIGIRPKPLSLSIYKELITDKIWAEQRYNYGYRDVRHVKLMKDFGGFPYIDVKASFNSFIPNSLDEKISSLLVNYYLNKLIHNPHFHDKVEFEIVFSSFSFDLRKKLKELKDHSFSSSQISELEASLKDLTNNIIKPNSEILNRDYKNLERLIKSRNEIFNSKFKPLKKIFLLLENTKLYGTLPFAGFARTSFIAVQFIESMVSNEVFDKNDKALFYKNLSTITGRMVRDKRNLEKEAFLKIYGHLRPGTYNILSPRYDENPDIYFDWDKKVIEDHDEPFNFKLDHEKFSRLENLLKKNNLETEPTEFLSFLKKAIEYREYSKFEFTKNLSDILNLIKKWGKEFCLDNKDLAFLNINDLKEIYSNKEESKALLFNSVNTGKKNFQDTVSISLPPIITNPDEVYGFKQPNFQPSFITNKNAIGEVALAISKSNLEGKIICIENADPGYDWLFDHKIAGFITAWGGCNSHMAIRSGELSIPAVIGVGELTYNRYSGAKTLKIDCLNQQVFIIS